MKYILKSYSIWEFGKRRDAEGNPHQEDSLYPAFGEQTDKDRTFILCDGMGGHDAGEVASATVCESMSSSIMSNEHDEEGVFTDDDLFKAISVAYETLDRKDNGAEKKMGTTMTFLKLHNEGATIAHIGDSRVYHIRPGRTGEETQILFATEDHSLVNDLIKIGELTREEARFSKQKNIITRAMQPNVERRSKPDVYHTSDIKPGDYFYLCSDGMLEQPDMESGKSIKNIFSSQGGDDERKIEILIGATDENKDNHTAIIVHILDVIYSEEFSTKTVSEDMLTKHIALIEDDEIKKTDSDNEIKGKESEYSNENVKDNEEDALNSSSDSGCNHPVAVLPHNTDIAELEKKKNYLSKRTVLIVLFSILLVGGFYFCLTSVKSCSTFKIEKKEIRQKHDLNRTSKENETRNSNSSAIKKTSTSATSKPQVILNDTEYLQQSVSALENRQSEDGDIVVSSDQQIIVDNINKP